jgi:hypothetical protein
MPSDVHAISAELFFLPITTRVPLKFGPETLTTVTVARVRLRVEDATGAVSEGWGETPLSVQWVWPSQVSYQERHEVLKRFTRALTEAWAAFPVSGHPIEVGHTFQREVLPDFLTRTNEVRGQGAEPMPWLAALVCCSPFDIALVDSRMTRRTTSENWEPEIMANTRVAERSTTAEESSGLRATCPFLRASARLWGVAFSVLSCPPGDSAIQ